MKLRVIKELNKENSWAPRTIAVGELLYDYPGCTYGCISNEGVAATEVYGKTPFFEVPQTHVEEVA